ncbi:MAG: hypothetical protein COU51_01300 [Parcubacteria group bacterium CG10_big_fil_rev_8_21_14_0_10_36_14]|nr:MAG: hypothetical protein COU51_01300 [Parcubacteria group bacterium CG10_big_fil_rev_8_21_14_0_10_36_14]
MDQLFDWLKNEQMVVDTCDEVAVAGSIKDLVRPQNPGEAEFILKQIEISARLHKIERVIIMNHTDCGAYGGKSAFNGDEDEERGHLEDMRKAGEIIKNKWTHLEIMLVLANLNPNGKIDFRKMA